VQDERLEEKGKENITSPVRSRFLWMMNEQKVVKNNNQTYISLGKKARALSDKGCVYCNKKRKQRKRSI